MKNLLFCSSIFILSITFISCGKSSNELTSNYDKIDILFNQLKADSNYKNYYLLLKETSEIFLENSKKTGVADTSTLNNNKLSLNDKYKKLGYTNYDVVESNSFKMMKLYTSLKKAYPIFDSLTETENKKLILLSKKFFIYNK